MFFHNGPLGILEKTSYLGYILPYQTDKNNSAKLFKFFTINLKI